MLVGVALVLAGVGVLVARGRILDAMKRQLGNARRANRDLAAEPEGIMPSKPLIIIVGFAWVGLGAAMISLSIVNTT